MAINNPALWAVMKVGARNAMIKTAEKSGIPWQETYTELQQSQAASVCSSKLLHDAVLCVDHGSMPQPLLHGMHVPASKL